jgi:hypothetical protein
MRDPNSLQKYYKYRKAVQDGATFCWEFLAFLYICNLRFADYGQAQNQRMGRRNFFFLDEKVSSLV